MKVEVLGGLSAPRFFAEYWQKRPLLVRAALPGFSGLVGRAELESLACDGSVPSRLVIRRRDRWDLRHGAFRPRDFKRLPKQNWTLLVQDLNHVLPSAAALLSRFSFIPYARLDDVMVSFATIGGGVGPHLDSYDVFLLQGTGTRRWQICAHCDTAVDRESPLKILQRFRAEQEWVLHSGDLLYLPPGCAHNGIALTDCFTYSIGFRAPSSQELVVQFLAYLEDQCALPGMYADPDLRLQRHAAAISDAMLKKVSSILANIRWNNADVARFMGQYLTEPKTHVVFSPPKRPHSRAAFHALTRRSALQLDLKTQMLFRARKIFLNGEFFPVSRQAAPALIELANKRRLGAGEATNREAEDLLYDWYLSGYLHASV
jgi:50S ribosomal protein L16 3-hydroxylase